MATSRRRAPRWHDARTWFSETVAMRRPGTPEDVAAVCVMLADAGYVTGSIIPVDGGLSLL